MNKKHLWILGVTVLICFSCGKEKKEEFKKQATPVKQEASASGIKGEVPFRNVIESAGFAVTAFERFPAQEQQPKAWTILYKGSSGNRSGGIIYVKKTKEEVTHHWHWNFTDGIPESVTPIEINEDGLWDMRVVMAGGEIREFIQEDTFTLNAKGRGDWIALNAHATPPVDDDHPLWQCFDGDTASTWRVMSDAPEKPFIEISAPFGVKDGILGIRTIDEDQPKEVEIYVGEKRIDRVKLKRAAGHQLFHLPPDIQGATRVRLVFKSAYSDKDMIAIAGLSLM